MIDYKRLGDYIKETNVRNNDERVELLLGVSIEKHFIPSIANTVGSDLSKYKVVKKDQFAYGPVTSRNGDRLSVALLKDYEKAIISQSYVSFEVTDTNRLLPDYLMMWFSRPEFDRYARYKSHGSTRETFSWEEMCNVKLPVPSIEKQQKIVQDYQSINKRIQLNEKLIQKLEESAQAIYKHWFVDFEFPITKEYAESTGKPELQGKPYKSNGGEMVWEEELGKEIPEGWNTSILKQVCLIKGGKRLPKGEDLSDEVNGHPYIKVADMGSFKFVVLNKKFEYVPSNVQPQIARYIVSVNDIILSIVGTIGIIKIIHHSLDNANLTENCVKLTNFKKISGDFLYHFLVSDIGKREIEIKTVGGVQGKLPIYNIETLQFVIPDIIILDKFTLKINHFNEYLKLQIVESAKLEEMRDLLLSKMTKIELKKESEAV